MGLTHVSVEIANPVRPSRRLRRKMLVDSGAMYTVIDGATLRRLGIRPTGERVFVLADGTHITRATSIAMFRFQGRDAASTVVFGEPSDAALLGVITLEEFGLMLDPVRGKLRPIPLPLMASA